MLLLSAMPNQNSYITLMQVASTSHPTSLITENPSSCYMTGTAKSMVPGQTPVALVTANIRTTVLHALTSSFQNSNLSPPQTAAEVTIIWLCIISHCIVSHHIILYGVVSHRIGHLNGQRVMTRMHCNAASVVVHITHIVSYFIVSYTRFIQFYLF